MKELSNSLAIEIKEMIHRPATKITNLGAMKIVLGTKNFVMYIAFSMAFALACGLIVNIIM
ncbi:hypothetical protein AGMMS49983_15300 [Clostridia bacterium]|nr:hypothetical protein AGMMS49983_15300 [Clostridia bacterium]